MRLECLVKAFFRDYRMGKFQEDIQMEFIRMRQRKIVNGLKEVLS